MHIGQTVSIASISGRISNADRDWLSDDVLVYVCDNNHYDGNCTIRTMREYRAWRDAMDGSEPTVIAVVPST